MTCAHHHTEPVTFDETTVAALCLTCDAQLRPAEICQHCEHEDIVTISGGLIRRSITRYCAEHEGDPWA